jgi:arylsulfatase A-like enzyme
VFSVARARGYRTAAFFSKPKFQPLQRPGTLDYTQAPGGWWGGWATPRTIGDVERYLVDARPNLLFVHLLDPDRAGHDEGWMSPAYGRAVREVDAGIARLLDASRTAFGAGQYAVIVTADHGGHGRNHGSDDPRDVTIPWIAWGQGIEPAIVLEANAIDTYDTAPTILTLLGIATPEGWNGTTIQFLSSATP